MLNRIKRKVEDVDGRLLGSFRVADDTDLMVVSEKELELTTRLGNRTQGYDMDMTTEKI